MRGHPDDMPAQPTAPTAPSVPREPWADAAKGLCILLVVLHHTVGKHYVPLMSELSEVEPFAAPPLLPAWVAQAWHELTEALRPVRMPLFFALSGFFASRAVHRPWPAARARVLGGYYLYVVWLLFFALFYVVESRLPANRTEDLADLGRDLVWASTSMWFLFALPVYFVIAKALRQWPRATLAAAATLAGSLSWFGIEEVNRAQVLFCFLFFAIGAYRPRLVSDAVARLPVPAALGAFVLALAIVNADVVPRSIPVLVAGVAGVALGLAVARHLARSVLADAFAWLGRRTMRVYVLHLVVLSAVMYLPSPLTRGPLAGSLPFALVYPLVLTAFVVAACLGLYVVLARLTPWLFAAPAWVVAPAPVVVPGRPGATRVVYGPAGPNRWTLN